jgi:hypothetical protein
MPSKTKKAAAAANAAQLHIPADWLDQLATGPMTAGQVQELFDQFKKAVLERALAGELSHHLGYAPGQAKPEGVMNQRNGTSAKTVLTDAGGVTAGFRFTNPLTVQAVAACQHTISSFPTVRNRCFAAALPCLTLARLHDQRL